MDLDQVIELFTAKHTCELADRHTQSIIALCEQMDNEISQEGFFYQDLDKVAHVLALINEGLIAQRVSTTRKFVTVTLVWTRHGSWAPVESSEDPFSEA